ncbi:MAG: HDIG domain-containing protein [Candidatus Stahlbacteria bacterium]|nr:HDIG domain-containing protein [Candidatus Stahlbacteria bacterium]
MKVSIKNIILAICFLIILNLLYPSPLTQKFSLKSGDIAPRDIVAPYTFYIQKSKREFEDEKRRARESVFFVLRRDNDIPQTLKKEVAAFFTSVENIKTARVTFNEKRAELMDLVPALDKKEVSFLLTKDYTLVKDSLLVVLNEVLQQGIIDSVSKIGSPVVVILGEEKPKSVREFLDLNSVPLLLKERAAQMVLDNQVVGGLFISLATIFMKPNLIVDITETLKRREEVIAKVGSTKGIVLKGEMIVRAYDIVTQEVVEKISSLSKGVGVSQTPTFIGRNIIYLIAIIILFVCLSFLSTSILDDFRKLLLLILLMTIVIGVSSMIILAQFSWYLIPIALFGILAALLLGTSVSLSGVIVLTILISAYSGGEFEPLVLFLFSGVISVFMSANIKKPSDVYLPVIYISAAYICTAVGMELIKFSPTASLLKSLIYAVIGGAGSSIVAFGLLPIFEKMFKITTPITLLEYANPDSPILRNLFTYAPGTYHHSMAVATLAEGAARDVGANSLLSRVGAYYHDIGKLKMPDYFIENQSNGNPHPNVSPELKARVIISHIREGEEIAMEENLPREIVNIIKEHHGTTLVESFYTQAKEKDTETNELDFRYTGPLPHTKESAIIMLADTVEAATRSLSNPIPVKIKGVVEGAIEKKMDDGQFAKVNLSIAELGKIKDSFIPILIAMFHQRIPYVKDIHKEQKSARG